MPFAREFAILKDHIQNRKEIFPLYRRRTLRYIREEEEEKYPRHVYTYIDLLLVEFYVIKVSQRSLSIVAILSPCPLPPSPR